MVSIMWELTKAKLKVVPRGFLLCVALRTFSVYFVQTSFVPDEYWQSLEVAHKIAFGYGYLTWEWRLGIRSYICPAFIAVLYKILEIFKCDTVESLVLLPRLTQALLSAVGDYYFVKWHQKTTASNGNWAWFTVLTSWFWFYCASRTLANTLETTLAMIGLYLYPWEQVVLDNTHRNFAQDRNNLPIRHFYLWFVGFACIVRPTAAIFWCPLVAFQLIFSKRKKYLILSKCLPIATSLIIVSMEIDTYFHGTRVVTWWNFFHVNVTKGVGEFYGSHSFFWYFVIGLPSVLGSLLLPFVLGVVNSFKTAKTLNMEVIMMITGFWTISVLSFLPHKEFRFLLPILPLCFHMTASWLRDWSRRAKTLHCFTFATIIAAVSIMTSVYMGFYHQRGTLDAMKFLAKESKENPMETNLLFLMPCHSTPLYSHLHVNVPTRFLTCEPDIFESTAYIEEAEQFYAHPEGWLNRTYAVNGTSPLPSHIILFDTLRDEIDRFLNANEYHFLTDFYHTNFQEGRVGKYVVIFKRMVEFKSPPLLAFN